MFYNKVTKEIEVPLGIEDLASILQMSKLTLKRAVRAKKIEAIVIGNSWTFTADAINEFVESHTINKKIPNGAEIDL